MIEKKFQSPATAEKIPGVKLLFPLVSIFTQSGSLQRILSSAIVLIKALTTEFKPELD